MLFDASRTVDPDGDELRFQWEQVLGAGDPINLTGTQSAVASFVAPDRAQRLFFRLFVSDARATVGSVVLAADVLAPPNTAPVAVAPAEILSVTGETVILDGSASTDADGDPLTYRWEQIAGSGDPVTLQGATSRTCSFLAPDREQRLFFRLVVNDGKVDSQPAVVRVVVNAPPIAVAGGVGPRPIRRRSLVEGSGYELDGGIVVGWRWTVVSARRGRLHRRVAAVPVRARQPGGYLHPTGQGGLCPPRPPWRG